MLAFNWTCSPDSSGGCCGDQVNVAPKISQTPTPRSRELHRTHELQRPFSSISRPATVYYQWAQHKIQRRDGRSSEQLRVRARGSGLGSHTRVHVTHIHLHTYTHTGPLSQQKTFMLALLYALRPRSCATAGASLPRLHCQGRSAFRLPRSHCVGIGLSPWTPVRRPNTATKQT